MFMCKNIKRQGAATKRSCRSGKLTEKVCSKNKLLQSNNIISAISGAAYDVNLLGRTNKKSLLILLISFFIICGFSWGLNKKNQAPHKGVSFQEFRRSVAPIFEKRCASLSCHGIAVDSFKELIKDPDRAKAFYFPVDPLTGAIPQTTDALLTAFRTAREDSRVSFAEQPVFSPLLRIPLAQEFGGLPHRGLDVFLSIDDPDFRTIAKWIATEIAQHPVKPKTMAPELAFFRKNVLNVMIRNGCFLASCHSPNVSNDLKLVSPLPVVDSPEGVLSGFSAEMVEQNRKQMLGAVSRFANLGGDIKKSRLLVKNLPIAEGGVHQKGGNNQFFESYDDPDVKIILEWLKLERKALASQLTSEGKKIMGKDLGRLRGLVFIRGPKHAPRRFFDLDSYWPGSDIFLLNLGPEETLANAKGTAKNLTARFHPAKPVEIQSLDVRYDAKSVVFSMRTSPNTGFRLYEISLDENQNYIEDSFRQISFGNDRLKDGTLVHHIDPIYKPGPEDNKGTVLDDVTVVFASNAAGAYAASDTWGLLGEADGGNKNSILDIQRTESPGFLEGRRIYFVDGPNRGLWRKIVSHLPVENEGAGSELVLDKPLLHLPDRKTVYVIEKPSASYLPAYDIWRLVPLAQNSRKAFQKTARRMTFTDAQERRPTMRTSGEVMFTTVRNIGYQADRPVFNGAIFRMQAGGFDYHIQGGNRSQYPLYTDSRELPSGLEVRLALDPRNLWGGGLLLLVDHGFGVNIEPDNPVDNIPFHKFDQKIKPAGVRFLPTQLPFFPEKGVKAVTATGISPGGSFRDPYPLPGGTILASHVPRSLDHLNSNANPDWDIYAIQFEKSLQSEDGSQAGAKKLIKINAASTEKWAEYSPKPLVIRLKENTHNHQKFAAQENGRKPKRINGVLRMPGNVKAEIECYDYPLLQSFLTNFAPLGPRDFRSNSPGSIGPAPDPDHTLKYVRMIMQVAPGKKDLQAIQQKGPLTDPFATPVSMGIHTRSLIIGEIPLEADGSFYVEVPPEVPLRFQGLNRNKMVLHSMNRWFYTQPGEKLTFSIPRSIFPMRCGGCHGALTGNMRDALGPPDIVSASSRVMANWDPYRQKKRPAFNKGKGYSDYFSIDFRSDIQAILDKRCVSCHGDSGQNATGLDLRGIPTEHYTIAYESLHILEDPESGDFANKRYINEREGMAIESYLMEKLMGRELDAPQKLKKPGFPHPSENPLSEEELLSIIRWIDLGATFLGGKSTLGGHGAATNKSYRSGEHRENFS